MKKSCATSIWNDVSFVWDQRKFKKWQNLTQPSKYLHNFLKYSGWLLLTFQKPRCSFVTFSFVTLLSFLLATPTCTPWKSTLQSVRIQGFPGPYFSAFGLNTEGYRVSLRIWSKCGKRRTRKTPNTGSFYAVLMFGV